MRSLLLRNISVGFVLLATLLVSMLLKPSDKAEYIGPNIVLDELIPKSLDNWREDTTPMPVVSPDVQAALDMIYAQTLSRTYINEQGDRVMLSIAYGRSQSDSLAIHLPEGCYQGQGFGVNKKLSTSLHISSQSIPITRLIATKSLRVEPITYWIVIGDKVVNNAWDMKKVKLQYALKREIPNGFLIRVSNINPNADQAYKLQQDFIEKMIKNVRVDKKEMLIGRR